MPDYRVTMTIGALRAGVTPDAVLPAAAAGAAELAMVEASDLAIVAGVPRITVRFESDDAELARQIGDHVAAVTDGSAQVLSFRVTERVRGRWFPVG
jgi:hypothetical protein